ncbi:MAG: GNAT family N-acetyltransferase [Rhodobacteraceae bacterium]|nr:GNAT family N-acetyltransferase [Paracoccaceae bacterium]
MTATIREATRGDTLPLESFLKRRMETSMFLRSNLRDYGIGNTEAPYATRYFLSEKGGEIQGVGAISNGGSLMMQASEGLAEICDFMQSVLPDDTVYSGMLGNSAQVEIMREAFGLANAPTTMDDVEPLFSLTLAKLIVPSSEGAILRQPEQSDIALLNEWGYDYLVETGLREAGAETRETVKDDVARRIESYKLRILAYNGKPVAQTGFNAVFPDSVQIGGVYTPPEHRCNGYGRLAVALHLNEARAQGVKQAILFSANEYASRAYRGIGFEQIGHYTLTIFATPETKE